MSTPEIVSVPGARPVCELGVGDTRIPVGQARWDVSLWDDPGATWSGLEPTWFDISCDVIDVELEMGRDRSMETWAVGTATITVDNSSGWADIGNAPPPEPILLTPRPGRQIRVGMALDGGPVRWLWRGFIDDAEPTYDAEDQDVVTYACIDAKGWAGKVDLAQVEPPVGANEAAHARITRILNAAGWEAKWRQINATSVTLLATSLGARAVDLLDLAADSAGGVVFGDARGYVVFKPRDWQMFDPDLPPAATIGNGPGDVCPTNWERAFRLVDVATRTVVARHTDTMPQVYDDLAARSIYGIETIERTDLECTQTTQLEILGRRWLQVASPDYLPRVAAVTIDAATSTGARDLAFSVDPTLPSRYRCRHARDDGTVVFDAEFLATGVSHRISRDGWECRIALDNAAPYEADAGRWDSARWDQATWWAPVTATKELQPA